MAIYFENKMPTIETRANMATTLMVRQMLEDTWLKATPITPMSNQASRGHLRAAVNRRMIDAKSGYIEWLAPYASYQDRGMRADGTRVVKNYTTPGTHARFASESVANVLADLPRYAQMYGELV